MRKRLPSLPQSLTLTLVIFRATSPLSWQTGTEQNRSPTIQEEMVTDLCHLGTHKSMELDGIHPRALRELAEEQNNW